MSFFFCFCVPLYSITFGDMRQISSQEAYCLLWMSLFVHFRFLNLDILLYNVRQRFSDIVIYKISIYWYILNSTSVVFFMNYTIARSFRGMHWNCQSRGSHFFIPRGEAPRDENEPKGLAISMQPEKWSCNSIST